MPKTPTPSPAAFRRRLLSWHGRHGRHGLPWRGTFSPYGVLLSEFMLQQTTVSTVIPYFHKFLKTFPTLKDLAAAAEERVLELWAGLGYYARARNLRAAAGKIVKEFGGRLPDTREGCESLPGVGPYTAGALLSFAYDKPEALVDGNVIRVLSRIYGIRDDVKSPKTLERIWALARKLVPPAGARRFNSALMDFGATACRPSAPECPTCPFFKDCWARRHGKQEELPRAAPDRAKKEVTLHVGLVRHGGTWALVRRPDKGLYANMWEFPSMEAPAKTGPEAVAEKWGLLLGGPVEVGRRLPPLAHTLTHRELKLHPWLGRSAAAAPKAAWKSRAEIRGMAVASYTKKLLALLPG